MSDCATKHDEACHKTNSEVVCGDERNLPLLWLGMRDTMTLEQILSTSAPVQAVQNILMFAVMMTVFVSLALFDFHVFSPASTLVPSCFSHELTLLFFLFTSVTLSPETTWKT